MGKIFSKNNASLIFCLIFIVLLFTNAGRTDAAYQEDELFEKAYNHYLSYQPEKAIDLFNLFLDKYPESSSRDAALFWKARALFQTNKKDEAVNIYKEIIDEFPASHFRGFAESELENIAKQDKHAADNKTDKGNSRPTEALADNIRDKQKDELQKKLLLAEKATLKAVEEKNNCIEAFENEKKNARDLTKRTEQLFETIQENQNLKEELRIEKENRSQFQNDASLKAIKEKNSCLSLLEDEKKKSKDLSQQTKRHFDIETENQRLKEEIEKIKEQNKIADKKTKEELMAVDDYKYLRANFNECDSKIKIFAEEDRKNQRALTVVSQERDDLAARLMLSEKNETELRDRLTNLQTEQQSLSETGGHRMNNINSSYEPDNRIRNLEKEIAVLSERLKQYEIPFFQIGNRKLTAAQVIDEYQTASEVEKKLRKKTVSWKKGDAYEDLLMEQALLNKAEELKIQRDAVLFNMLTKKYSFSEKEKSYLSRYLTVDKLISRITGNIYIAETDIRRYYETNKHDFLVAPGKEVVNVLSVNYNADNELERNLLTIDIQNKAAKGHSLEDIRKNQPDTISLKQYDLSQSPDWIKEEANKLKAGEISTIISKDTEYIIIQTWRSMPVYENYEDVSYMIRGYLLEKSRADNQALNVWLRGIQDENVKTPIPSTSSIALKTDDKTVKPKSKSLAPKKKRSKKTKKTTLKKKY